MSAWSSPAVVFVAATLATIAILIEVALPTLGFAGLFALSLSVLAAWGIDARSLPAWPFVFVALAVLLWAIELVTRSNRWRWVALASFGVGASSFAIVAGDLPTVIVATLACVVMVVTFTPIDSAMGRLLGRQADTGMESMPGRRAVVDRWEAIDTFTGHGVVILAGTRWNATGPASLEPGVDVTIVETSGLNLTVIEPEEPT